jgi:hypothetical protein
MRYAIHLYADANDNEPFVIGTVNTLNYEEAEAIASRQCALSKGQYGAWSIHMVDDIPTPDMFGNDNKEEQ